MNLNINQEYEIESYRGHTTHNIHSLVTNEKLLPFTENSPGADVYGFNYNLDKN